MDSIRIFDVRVDNIDFNFARDKIKEFLRGDRLEIIYTPNPEIVMKARSDQELKNILDEASLVTADGIGLIYASRIKKKPLKERVTGFDMSIEMLEIANKHSYSLYLLGGAEGVAKKAAENIRVKYPNIRLAGYHNGFFKGSHNGNKSSKEELEILDDINRSKVDILFVGLGFPRQELFIHNNKDRLEVKLAIGNGGVIDILGGVAKRAPEIWQKLGLEWLYRLIKNPSRIKRQLILPKFLLEVIFKKNVVS